MTKKTASQDLGAYSLVKESFKQADVLFKEFQAREFKTLSDQQKRDRINHSLLRLIREAPEPAFLLSSVASFIERIGEEAILERYSFASFEFWLNQFSGVSAEENYRIRTKIVGKCIPREAYQVLFPIGMGKRYPGSHYVTAHSSPDLDTIVASFWGWVDAFAARVSDGLHLWNVPGGPPSSLIELDILFFSLFGQRVFEHLAKTRSTLSLSSLELLSQRGVVKKLLEDSILSIDHDRQQNAVLLVDGEGHYLGDWRHFDVESVRQVIELLGQCLRWLENYLHRELVALFAKKTLTKETFNAFVHSVFDMQIKECDPAKKFSPAQKAQIEAYLKRVLLVPNGFVSTFKEFSAALKHFSLTQFQEFEQLLGSFHLFDAKGSLQEERSQIFHFLEKVIQGLDQAIQGIESYVERLGVALEVKAHVCGHLPQSVSYRADVEELRSKIGDYPYLTVTSATDPQGRVSPLGVVHASDLHKAILGTVTLRDFCNREETKIPSYFEVISVVDHHKSHLSGLSAPVASIADVQSSNVLLAELAFQINDRYSTAGKTRAVLQAEFEAVAKQAPSPAQKRIMQRLLQRLLVAERGEEFYIHPQRELTEYLHFLYAILDDTDFLSKVSHRDVDCVVALVNRLKSLMIGQEVEVITIEDLVRDGRFAETAAKRILQNEDMASVCRKIYEAKELAVEENLILCAQGLPSNIFSDTKEQNGCCRVGQTKLFTRNYPTFKKQSEQICLAWYEQARLVFKGKNEVDLHMHMISTLSGAESLGAAEGKGAGHKDELWIWIPDTDPAAEHLRSFLDSFSHVPLLMSIDLEVEFPGANAAELERIFKESFLAVPRKKTACDQGLPIAIIRYRAGAINSRKALISPHLPRLI